MSRSLRATVVQLALAFVAAVPLSAQGIIGVLGLDGVMSNRDENAFGLGVTLTYGHRALSWSLGGTRVSLKVMGVADLEIVAGTLEPGMCRYPEDGYYYYVQCADTSGTVTEIYAPTVAEASSPTKFYTGLYAAADVWRARLGVGGTGHPGSGDWAPSVLLGFAASTSSWLMVELPDLSGWRLRIEIAVAGPPFIW